jgi:tetratricopeptide (TPR) repeat protein
VPSLVRGARLALALSAALLAGTALPTAAAPIQGDAALSYSSDASRWLLHDEMLGRSERASDPEALAAVAALFREGHPRASVALQNYFERFPNDAAAFDLAGVALLGEGKYDAALLSFDRASVLGADGPWFDAKLGLAHVMAGQLETGGALLRKVIEAEPTNPLARRYLAWLAMREDDLPRAIRHSEAALAAFGLPQGGVNRAHLDLADLYRRAQRHRDVHVLLRPAVATDGVGLPREVEIEAVGLFLDAALELRDADGAGAALGRLAALGLEGTPQYRLAEARAALVSGEPEDAVARIEALRAEAPDLSADLVPDLARAEAEAGRVGPAVARLTAFASTKGAGHDLPVYREAAALVLSKGGADAADDLARDLLAAPEGRVDLRFLGIEVLARSGDRDGALEEADRLLSVAPQEGTLHRLRGVILKDLGRDDEAEAALRRAVELAPGDAEAWLMLVGAVHGHEGYAHAADEAGHGEVVTLLERGVEANPDSARLRTELGLVHLSDGDLDGALQAFAGALERSPGYLPALTLAALAEADRGEDLVRAEELAERAAALGPDTAIITDIRGWIAFRQGDEAEAGRLLDAAVDLDPEDTTTIYHRAVLAEALGEEGAADLYLASLRLGDIYAHYRDGAREALARLGTPDRVTGTVVRIGPDGEGETLGTVEIRPEGDGVSVAVDVAGLPAGLNAAHVHENPSCRSADGVVGGEAGPHFGHAHVHMAAADGSLRMEPGGMGEMDHGLRGADMAHGTAGHSAASAGDGAMAGSDHGAMHGGMAEADVMRAAMPGHATADDGGAGMAELPRGDLPPLEFDAEGRSQSTVLAPQLALDEIRGRSLMIHLGPDEEGRSGPKIACAVLR